MIETIKYTEYDWFLWLNGHHNQFFDILMYWVTYRFTWIPLYIYIIYYLFQNTKNRFAINLVFVLLSVGLSDRFTSGFMKPFFHRFRPCHDPAIQNLVHVVGDCGGQFGFASSHASNSFALVMAIYLLAKLNNWSLKLPAFLLFWAIIVSYSRIYVGVHFPTDIVVGAIVGIMITLFTYIFLKFINQKLNFSFT
ncbi:phosphoesterase PA-phosphatase related protein [Emticicia oligotrophica DSM 17448]|uniref:Phosphoesterase PA-phosphatase related protein n=1 Tax=Emticicia oligotrophica (strain DSM 17448 / CIP 109782 / MTCC 6937 / GPTSA100-15) TaxID=929562 RepID=A0ABM5N754_EMTOG|nr:phosphatase PAP2 family protein [Emticicia oligotrophica]AFK05175.1 phosphoesterase PA-phosphatase related protein [Emticicia oligotrophica DSM 17448]